MTIHVYFTNFPVGNLVYCNRVSIGDKRGQFTFHSQGLSVIDFTCTNDFDLVRSMEIVSRCESDHSALKVLYSLQLEKEEGRVATKIRWKTDKSFLDRFATYIESSLVEVGESINERAIYITSCIQNFPDAQHQPKIIYKKPWFDKDCSKLRAIALRSLRLYKRSKQEIDKVDYKAQQCKYIALKKEKKRLYYEGLYEQFGQVSSSKDLYIITRPQGSIGYLQNF